MGHGHQHFRNGPPPRTPANGRPGLPFGFVGAAGGRLPKERRWRVYCATHHHHQHFRLQGFSSDLARNYKCHNRGRRAADPPASFRSRSAAVPQPFRSRSTRDPHQFRSRSTRGPHQFTSSASVPHQFRTSAAPVPHRCRRSSVVVPPPHDETAVVTKRGCSTVRVCVNVCTGVRQGGG